MRLYMAIYDHIHPGICILCVWTCILGVWTCILGVWTCILSVWTCIFVSGFVFWVSGFVFWVSGFFNFMDPCMAGMSGNFQGSCQVVTEPFESIIGKGGLDNP